jgi:DNA-binding MarR family transcriptional regulator
MKPFLAHLKQRHTFFYEHTIQKISPLEYQILKILELYDMPSYSLVKILGNYHPTWVRDRINSLYKKKWVYKKCFGRWNRVCILHLTDIGKSIIQVFENSMVSNHVIVSIMQQKKNKKL